MKEELKKCARCKQEKSIDKFYSATRCQSCKDYHSNYYKTHRQQEIDRSKRILNKDRNKTNKYKRELHRSNPINICLQHAKLRAKQNNLPFNITLEDLGDISICPILGITLKVNSGHAKDDSYSLDRIVPSLGYVKGNVAIISHKANTIKNNATIEDLEKVLIWMRSKRVSV